MAYYRTEYLHIEYYSANSVVICQWYGKCSSLQYRQALISFIRFCKRFNVQNGIMDERLLPAISPEDITWTNNNFLRAFNKLSLKRFAVLSPFDTKAEQQQEKLIQRARYIADLEIRAFEDLTSAYDWLITPAETAA